MKQVIKLPKIGAKKRVGRGEKAGDDYHFERAAADNSFKKTRFSRINYSMDFANQVSIETDMSTLNNQLIDQSINESKGTVNNR